MDYIFVLNPIARTMHQPLRPSQIENNPPNILQPIITQLIDVADCGRLSHNIEGKEKNVGIVSMIHIITTVVPSLILAALPLSSMLHSKAIISLQFYFADKSIFN